MKNKSFIYSLIFHGTIFALIGVGAVFHKKRGIEIPNDTAVIVNFVKIGPKSQAPIIGQPPAKPKVEEEKKEVVKKEEKKEKKGDVVKKAEKKKVEKKSKAKKSEEVKGPIRLTPEDAQRADSFGLEIIASEASIIISKIKKYWNPPEIAENSGVKMKVFLSIDFKTGRITNYYILERKGPSEFYGLFESRIAATIKNPEIDFMDLSEETRKKIAEQGLEISFDSDRDEF